MMVFAVVPPRGPAAAPDPHEPRRRRHPGRHRHLDGHPLRHARVRPAWPRRPCPSPVVRSRTRSGGLVRAACRRSRRRPCWARSAAGCTSTVLLFLNYLLYSKHSHIIAALPNIYFRNLGQRGVLPKLNLEADDMAARPASSPSTRTSPGSRCWTASPAPNARAAPTHCPAYNTGKPLSPMHVVHDVRDDLKARMPDRGPLDALLERMQHGATARRSPSEATAPDRRPHQRRGVVGVHHLRRLPGGLPGLHRAARA